MKILFIGDVTGQDACDALGGFLPGFKRENKIDVTIINGENSADGNGLTPHSASLLFKAGADVITTGNHCFKRQEADGAYERREFLLRPANFGDEAPGKGVTVIDRGSYCVAVINLIGTAFMPPADNPFKFADEILKEIETKNIKNIIVDFHAEATAEKKAMGYYLAGRVSAVIGTHTHVQTADEQIIDGCTGYITDAGMTGVHDSVLGVEKSIIIERHLTYYPKKHVFAKAEKSENGGFCINAVLLDIDEKSGKTLSISRINRKI